MAKKQKVDRRECGLTTSGNGQC